MNPIFKRIVTALSTAAMAVCALLWVPFPVILPLMILLVAAVHLEFSQMVARKREILVWPGVVAGVLYLITEFYGIIPRGQEGAMRELPLLELVFALALAVLFGKSKRPIEALATTVLGFVYIPCFLKFFIRIPQEFGMEFLLYVIAIVKLSDMGGFAIGVLTKKLRGDTHRMCPSISPNKSWEGMAGSLVGSVGMSLAFMGVTHYTVPRSIAFGVAAAIAGTLGDLVESRFKRECEVKDSATFMPAGLGGFLDMFDSLVFAPALFYSFL